jgi:hypothetical protein
VGVHRNGRASHGRVPYGCVPHGHAPHERVPRGRAPYWACISLGTHLLGMHLTRYAHHRRSSHRRGARQVWEFIAIRKYIWKKWIFENFHSLISAVDMVATGFRVASSHRLAQSRPRYEVTMTLHKEHGAST